MVKGGKVEIKQAKGKGRKAGFEWDCRFCGEQLRTEGYITDHYSKSHKNEGQQSHLPRSPTKLFCPSHNASAIVNPALQPFGKVQVCPDPECNSKLVEAK